MRNDLPHYCGCLTRSFLLLTICFGQHLHFSQPALKTCCQSLGSIHCTVSSASTDSTTSHCRVKESTLCSWLHRFLEAHEMNERNKEKEEPFPYHTLFQVHHHQNPKLTKFFQTCGRAHWVVTCQQGLSSNIVSHSVLHTGDLCKERHTQNKCSQSSSVF